MNRYLFVERFEGKLYCDTNIVIEANSIIEASEHKDIGRLDTCVAYVENNQLRVIIDTVPQTYIKKLFKKDEVIYVFAPQVEWFNKGNTFDIKYTNDANDTHSFNNVSLPLLRPKKNIKYNIDFDISHVTWRNDNASISELSDIITTFAALAPINKMYAIQPKNYQATHYVMSDSKKNAIKAVKSYIFHQYKDKKILSGIMKLYSKCNVVSYDINEISGKNYMIPHTGKI